MDIWDSLVTLNDVQEMTRHVGLYQIMWSGRHRRDLHHPNPVQSSLLGNKISCSDFISPSLLPSHHLPEALKPSWASRPHTHPPPSTLTPPPGLIKAASNTWPKQSPPPPYITRTPDSYPRDIGLQTPMQPSDQAISREGNTFSNDHPSTDETPNHSVS
jgi:hypothetical protein